MQKWKKKLYIWQEDGVLFKALHYRAIEN